MAALRHRSYQSTLALPLIILLCGTCCQCVGDQTVEDASTVTPTGAADDSSGSCSADSSGDSSSGSCGCGALKRGDFAPASASMDAAPAMSQPLQGKGESDEDASVIYLQGGKFTMGINKNDEDDHAIHPMDGEGPRREMTLEPFGLGAFEVSNQRFARFVEDTGYVTEAERYGWSFAVQSFLSAEVNASATQHVQNAPWWLPVEKAHWRHPHGVDTNIKHIMDHPVTHVSLADAAAFCEWSKPGGRLPTEPEWEFAARAGKSERRFPWGNRMLTGKNNDKHRMNIWQSEVDYKLVKDGKVLNLYQHDSPLVLVKEYYSARNLAKDGYATTAPVDTFGRQNEFGFYNLVGNVWEWTSTKWERIGPDAPPVDPNTMVKKGGSFLCNKATCYRYRNSARMMFTADSSAANVGFRCAYAAKPEPAVAAVE